ncbi:hypothetical protein ACHAWF_018806 [Thalassiosira exigua]
MLENQAFGWLKNAISGGVGGSVASAVVGSPTNAAAIGACADPSALVRDAAKDFRAAAGSPAHSGGGDSRAAPSEGGGAASDEDGSAHDERLDDLTARLDRIKILLYEERSASSSAAASAGAVSLNWTPAVATGTFKSLTAEKGGREQDGAEGDADAKEGDGEEEEEDLLPALIRNLRSLPFEARKSVSAIFNYLLVCGLDGADRRQFASVSSAFAAYVLERADAIISQLVRAHHCKPSDGSGRVDIALLCGSMLRSSLRHASIYKWMLSDGNCERLVYPFLDGYVHNPNFDVSSDALETVRAILTGTASGTAAAAGVVTDPASEEHKQIMEGIASDFLSRKYDDVIDGRINRKCLSSKANYMTRRMSLQTLSTILLNRANYGVMMAYISSSKNLVTIMCLLRDPSPHITLDAFQVFKIFVANPNKPPEVVKILYDNKVKLVKYLEGLHKDRESTDDQYRDEKQLVISTLEGLEI